MRFFIVLEARVATYNNIRIKDALPSQELLTERVHLLQKELQETKRLMNKRKEYSTMINEILKYNKKFMGNKGYEKFVTNKYPDKKIAILSCMDTRLTELLPAALGVNKGDVKMIKNAGGIISPVQLCYP